MCKKLTLFLCLITLTLCLPLFWACSDGGNAFVLTFDGDGGVLSFNSKTLSTGDEINLPTATKEGYKFVCFVYSFSGKDYIIEEGDAFGFRTDITAKAKWAPADAYIIRYDTDGGFFNGENKYYYYANEGDVALSVPQRIGYKFLYWEDGENVRYETSLPNGSVGDKTLTAKYLKSEYTVSLILTCEALSPVKDGKTETVVCLYKGESEKTFTVPYGDTLGIIKAVPIDSSNYEFICWTYTDKNGKTERFYGKGETNVVVFNEDMFTLGETVYLKAYCVPSHSEFI